MPGTILDTEELNYKQKRPNPCPHGAGLWKRQAKKEISEISSLSENGKCIKKNLNRRKRTESVGRVKIIDKGPGDTGVKF